MALLLLVLFITISPCLSLTEVDKDELLQNILDKVLNLEKKLDQVPNLERRLEQALARIYTLEKHQESHQVAFSVYHNEEVNFKANQRVEYHKVFTNLGGGYMTAQQEFICPQSGMYMFTQKTTALFQSLFFSNMYMNDVIIASGWGGTNAESASNSVVIHCEAGTRVYVQCGPDHACQGRAADFGLEIMQTFSGFLIYAEDD